MSGKPGKINVVTLGCSKNLVDSELLLGSLNAAGFSVVHNYDGPCYAVIVNTCGFINDAKEESIETILSYIQQKKMGNIFKVIVAGCLSERYRQDLKREIPEVDGWFGVAEQEGILRLLDIKRRHVLDSPRLLTTPAHYAYLKIAEGCDRTCSFCAIPLIRGKNTSRPINEIVEEAKLLSRSGVKELLVIAQDTTWYGLDLDGKRLIAELLKELSSINGIDWIRLHYAYPAGFPDNLIKVIAEHQNICKYIDLPVQHISDRILKSMKRGSSGKEIRLLIEKLRRQIPGLAIRTTLIVGYPGETVLEFKELCDFVNDTRFDRLGVFTYSPEEGTTAFSLDDNVSAVEKNRRLLKIMQLQQEISLQKNNEKKGTNIRVIIDGQEGEFYVGRSEHDSPEIDNEILISATGNHLKIGDFYMVHIDSAEEYDLFATLIK